MLNGVNNAVYEIYKGERDIDIEALESKSVSGIL